MYLDSVRVLDLTRLLPGPYATQLLADAGADVIKIEDTDAGDYARLLPPFTDDGTGAIFDAVNRGKRSVALDLKDDDARGAFFSLVETADVVIESFRPGVVDRLGIGYEEVREYNDDIVYCSLTGYGQDGPLADRAGHDLNYIGRAGLLDLTRKDETTAPVIPGFPIADMAGGLFAAFSTVGALLSRELGNTGGEYIDVAMTDIVLSFAQALAPEVFAGESETPRPGDTPLTGRDPWYDIYETKDGKYVTFAALEPQFFEAFCTAVDRADLASTHGTTDDATRQALRETLTDLFASKTRREWEQYLSDVEAAVEPVYTLTEALEAEGTEIRDLQWGDPARIGFPAMGSHRPTNPDKSPPAHGEHTRPVLQSVGYETDGLDRLLASGAILAGDS